MVLHCIGIGKGKGKGVEGGILAPGIDLSLFGMLSDPTCRRMSCRSTKEAAGLSPIDSLGTSSCSCPGTVATTEGVSAAILIAPYPTGKPSSN